MITNLMRMMGTNETQALRHLERNWQTTLFWENSGQFLMANARIIQVFEFLYKFVDRWVNSERLVSEPRSHCLCSGGVL